MWKESGAHYHAGGRFNSTRSVTQPDVFGSSYWPALFGATPEFIKAQLKDAADAEVPLILGELCAYGACPGGGADKTESVDQRAQSITPLC